MASATAFVVGYLVVGAGASKNGSVGQLPPLYPIRSQGQNPALTPNRVNAQELTAPLRTLLRTAALDSFFRLAQPRNRRKNRANSEAPLMLKSYPSSSAHCTLLCHNMHANLCVHTRCELHHHVAVTQSADWFFQINLALVDLVAELLFQSLCNLLARYGTE